MATADACSKVNYRIATWIERDTDGWYCVVGFWWKAKPGDIGGDHADADDGFRVGPFASRQIARKELRGDFRRCVTEALRDLQRRGGKITAAQFGQTNQEERSKNESH